MNTDEIDLNAADFSDALMWLKDGKKVARAGWPNDKYVRLFSRYTRTYSGVTVEQRLQFEATNRSGSWVPDDEDLLATDWLVVEPDATILPAHQLRAIEELRELSERLQSLNMFLEGDTFKSLPEKQQHLLKCQATHMADYRDVLEARVAGF